MASLNKVTLIGNLGRDPEMKYMPSGEAVANVAIATTEKWKDKNTGEQKEATEWHRVSFFGRLAEIVGQYCVKGSSVYIEGSLKTRKYTDKDGVEKYATEITAKELKMLSGKPEGAGAAPAPAQQQRQAPAPTGRPAQGGAKPAPNFSSMDDDIPFLYSNNLLTVHTTSSQMMRAKHGRGMHLAHINQPDF